MRTIKSIVTKLSILLEKEEKKNLFLLLLLSVVSAFLEMLGVSMVVPLVSVIMDPAILTQEGVVLKLCSAFNISTHKDFVLLCVIGMIIVFVVKGLFLIATNYFRCGFVFNSRRKMQQKVLHAVIRKPYEFFLNTESGEIQRLIYNDVIYTYDVVMTLLSLISDSLVSLALILTIFFIDPIVTLMIAGFLAILLIIILKVIRPAVKDAGIKYRASTKGVYQWVIQIVHGIKEIKVAEREPLFEQKFAEAGKQHTEAERLYSVMNNVPKIFVEMGCICSALVIMAVMVASGRNPQTLVSAFAAFAMAAVKLMPAANRILTAANELSFRRDSLDKVLQILQNSDADMELFYRTEVSITLHREVELSHITYRYQGRKEEILSGASMIVPAGHSVGVIGPSGAGKTTAADILLGLLKPQKGQVLSDGTDVTENYQGWLDLVAYIPQTIFMMSGSIRENVVFGENESEEEKVWRALEEAQLADFVRGLPDGLDTQIGERGIRLSGGQRQRIGIARALYTDPQLLVFDEATSSLDNETESAIIGSINALHGKKTMVIIAHRLQTIENCDMVYRVPGDGSIIRER